MNYFNSLLKGEGLKAQLFKGAAGTAIVSFIGLFLSLIVGVLLARGLGPEGYGIYAFVLSLLALIALPTNAGLPTLLVREVSGNQNDKRWGYIKGLLRISNIFVFIYSVVAALFSLSLIYVFFSDSLGDKKETLLWALCLLPILSFEGVRTATLRGLRWVVSAQFPEQIVRPGVLIVLLCVVLYFDDEVTPVVAMQLNIFSAIVAFLIGFYLLSKAVPAKVKKHRAEFEVRAWLYSLFPLSIFSGLSILDSQITIVLLGLLGSADEVGLFRVAATGASLVSFGLSAINMALAPQIVRLYRSGEHAKLQRMISLTTRCAAIVSFPIALVFVLWGEQLIGILFGVEYVAAGAALIILCVAQLVNSTCGSVVLVLNMTGNEKATIIGAGVGLFLNVAFSVSLIPLYGLVGAAVGYALSLTMWNLILVYMTKKKAGLNTFLI